MPEVSVAPGWYKDPAEPTTQRWWDGEGWVGDPLPADVTPPPGPPPPAKARPTDLLREPQLPAFPGMPGAAEAPPPPPSDAVPPPEPTRPAGPGVEVPPGWPDRHPQGPPALQTPPRPHGYQLASLGARAVARLIDFVIVATLNVVVNGWFVYQFWTEISPVVTEAWRRGLAGENVSDLPAVGDQAGNLQIVIVVLAAALWFAYEVPAVANTGQTFGKRLLRIKVVRMEQAESLGFGRSFRRWNTMGLPTLLWWCFGIGFVLQLIDIMFALFDRPLQQALHDKSAHTVVVSVATTPRKETPDEQADPS
jgi:uncharacterized RDD family membrane protein YckC